MCDISIILVNYKRPDLTLNCIESIKNNAPNISYEIIVVDNHSDDGSFEKLKNRYKGISIIESEINGGFAYGNNLGARIAKGKYLFLLNNDTIINAGILDELYSYYELNTGIGVLGCKAVDGTNKELSVGHAFESPKRLWIQLYIKPILESLKMQRKVSLHVEGNKDRNCYFKEYDWVTGAAMFVKKDLYFQSKGLDSNFFMYMEDEDLCWRIKNMGYKNGVINKIGYTHFCGGSSIQSSFLTKEYTRSRILFFKRYFPSHFNICKRMIYKQISLINASLKDNEKNGIINETDKYIDKELITQVNQIRGI